MLHVNETIMSRFDGLSLEVLSVLPDEEICGIIQIAHGMSEHKERYIPFMEYMTARGYACIIHDHRGHGGSVEKSTHLGYMYGGGAVSLVEDLHQITKYAKKRWPDVPCILFGHSMGSMIVRMYTKKYDADIDALIVCGSPSKNNAVGFGKILAAVQGVFLGRMHKSKLIEAMSFGAFAKKFIKEKSKSAWCCSDPEVVKAYDDSEKCGFTFTVDGYLALFTLMQETYSFRGWKCTKPDLPILFIAGADDPCIGNVRKFKQAVDHMRMVGYKNVRGKLYPGMRHEILNEREKMKVFSDIAKYLRIQKKI